jgi:hypothetical protein
MDAWKGEIDLRPGLCQLKTISFQGRISPGDRRRNLFDIPPSSWLDPCKGCLNGIH